MKRLEILTAALLLAAFLPPEAAAQGCAMCLTSAMASGAHAAMAINRGVLVLLVPPFLMIVGILSFAFLRRSN